MFTQKRPSVDTMKDLTSEHLRTADKLVRLKRYDEALLEIENANKIDPKSVYIRSFLERTHYMIEKENEKRSQVFGEISRTNENRMEVISELFESVETFIREKKYPKALNELAKVYRIDPKNYNAQAFSDRIVALMRAETAVHKAQTPQSIATASDMALLEKPIGIGDNDVSTQPAIIPQPQSAPNSEQQEEVSRYALYRELLKECWADGVITPEDSDMLHRARSQYSISFDTHCRIEVDIKIDAYVDALRIVWRDGVVDDNENEILEIMRKKFGISQEEQAAAEEKFSGFRKTKQSKAMILIVENDHDNSIYVARALMNHGYDVKIERHPDDALRFLNMHTPDLILSEAVFPQIDTDGFEFFQRTRLDKRLSQIPFVMMTELGDARIMRAGLRMGVDYFIPKPLHIGYMVAIIEGKLKSDLQTTA
jgi:CheY-like chemotaxis protein